jgi:hypothetical protein
MLVRHGSASIEAEPFCYEFSGRLRVRSVLQKVIATDHIRQLRWFVPQVYTWL